MLKFLLLTFFLLAVGCTNRGRTSSTATPPPSTPSSVASSQTTPSPATTTSAPKEVSMINNNPNQSQVVIRKGTGEKKLETFRLKLEGLRETPESLQAFESRLKMLPWVKEIHLDAKTGIGKVSGDYGHSSEELLKVFEGTPFEKTTVYSH
jgi:hypothetical protein